MLELDGIEEVDAVPVPAPQPGYALARSVAPTTQAVMVAAGGFLAGAVVVGLTGRRRGRRARALTQGHARGRRGKASRAGELVQIVGTRSLLVDVHLLGDR